jgi:hypothetical protein
MQLRLPVEDVSSERVTALVEVCVCVCVCVCVYVWARVYVWMRCCPVKASNASAPLAHPPGFLQPAAAARRRGLGDWSAGRFSPVRSHALVSL